MTDEQQKEIQAQINGIAESLTPEEALRLWATQGKTEGALRDCYNRFVREYSSQAKTKREQLLGAIQGAELRIGEEITFEGFIIMLWAWATAYFHSYDIVEEFWT